MKEDDNAVFSVSETVEGGVRALRRQGVGNTDSGVVAEFVRHRTTESGLNYALPDSGGRPNADSTISLLTLGTASFLHVTYRTTLERRGLAASRRLESCMQSLVMT
jgi:hypothetical protein